MKRGQATRLMQILTCLIKEDLCPAQEASEIIKNFMRNGDADKLI